jgi:hypothetical protein
MDDSTEIFVTFTFFAWLVLVFIIGPGNATLLAVMFGVPVTALLLLVSAVKRFFPAKPKPAPEPELEDWQAYNKLHQHCGLTEEHGFVPLTNHEEYLEELALREKARKELSWENRHNPWYVR